MAQGTIRKDSHPHEKARMGSQMRLDRNAKEYVPSFFRQGYLGSVPAADLGRGLTYIPSSSFFSHARVSAAQQSHLHQDRSLHQSQPSYTNTSTSHSYKDVATLLSAAPHHSTDIHFVPSLGPTQTVTGKRKLYSRVEIMTLHQEWLRQLVYPKEEEKMEDGEQKAKHKNKNSVLLPPYGRVPCSFTDLVQRMKKMEQDRGYNSKEGNSISPSPLTAPTQVQDPHSSTRDGPSPSAPSLSPLLQEFLHAEGAARLLSHPLLVAKEENFETNSFFSSRGASLGEGESRTDCTGLRTSNHQSYLQNERKPKREEGKDPFPHLSLSSYYCHICAEGNEPCEHVRNWLSESSAGGCVGTDHADRTVIVSGKELNKNSRAYACLSQPGHVFRSLLQLSLILESKRGSARLRWITEQYPDVRHRILQFLCGEGQLAVSSSSNSSVEERNNMVHSESAEKRGAEPFSISLFPGSSALRYVPLPPVTAHDEWEEMLYWMGFDAIRDNKTRIVTDFSRHWKRRTLPFEQFVFFYSFRDHRPPAPVMNIVTRSAKPGMVAMLRMNIVALQLLHHHEFFIPEDHYWDVFPYLEEAVLSFVHEKYRTNESKSDLAPAENLATVPHSKKMCTENEKSRNFEEMYCRIRHIGLYLSATQTHLSLFSPVKKIF